MRSSVEGLNQEIEKLVLIPGLLHTCRPETSMVWFEIFDLEIDFSNFLF